MITADEVIERAKRHDRFIAGILYAVQQLVLFADQPTLAAEYLIKESGFDVWQFWYFQEKSGVETEKMKQFFNEYFPGKPKYLYPNIKEAEDD